MKTFLVLTSLVTAAGAAIAGAALLSKWSVDASATLKKNCYEPKDDFDDDIPTERDRLEAAFEQYRESVLSMPEAASLADIAAKMGVVKRELAQACWYYNVMPKQPVAVFEAYQRFITQFPKYAPHKLADNETGIPVEIARKIMLESGTPIIYFRDGNGAVQEGYGNVITFMEWMQGKSDNSPFGTVQ